MTVCDNPSVSRYKKNICRCEGCTDANTEYQRHRDRIAAAKRPNTGIKLHEETPAWFAFAACRQPGVDPEIFFPTKGTPGRIINQAKKICYGCPARKACLNYALANHEHFGIWGGLSERERRAHRKMLRRNGLEVAA